MTLCGGRTIPTVRPMMETPKHYRHSRSRRLPRRHKFSESKEIKEAPRNDVLGVSALTPRTNTATVIARRRIEL